MVAFRLICLQDISSRQILAQQNTEESDAHSAGWETEATGS